VSRLGVRWIGHATALLELDGARLLTDPLLRPRAGPLRNTAPVEPASLGPLDAVLVSHVHRDHLDLPSLRRLAPTRVVVPTGAATYLDARHDVVQLSVGQSTTVGALTVRAVKAEHHASRNPLGRAVEAVGYVVRGSRSVYFAGDTALYPQMSELAADELDVALLPVGGWGPTLGPGHMDAATAARALRLLRPRAAVPVHWGTLRAPLGPRLRPARYRLPGRDFVDAARELAPEVDARLLAPSDSFTWGD
jgi:L-ascorbate metabolism protein UlaG (beta-lactamase superfamily)